MPPSFTKNFICLQKLHSSTNMMLISKHRNYTEFGATCKKRITQPVQLIVKRFEANLKIICLGLYLNPGYPGDVYAGIWGYCALLTAGATGGFFAILTPRAVPLGVTFIFNYLLFYLDFILRAFASHLIPRNSEQFCTIPRNGIPIGNLKMPFMYIPNTLIKIIGEIVNILTEIICFGINNYSIKIFAFKDNLLNSCSFCFK